MLKNSPGVLSLLYLPLFVILGWFHLCLIIIFLSVVKCFGPHSLPVHLTTLFVTHSDFLVLYFQVFIGWYPCNFGFVLFPWTPACSIGLCLLPCSFWICRPALTVPWLTITKTVLLFSIFVFKHLICIGSYLWLPHSCPVPDVPPVPVCTNGHICEYYCRWIIRLPRLIGYHWCLKALLACSPCGSSQHPKTFHVSREAVHCCEYTVSVECCLICLWWPCDCEQIKSLLISVCCSSPPGHQVSGSKCLMDIIQSAANGSSSFRTN